MFFCKFLLLPFFPLSLPPPTPLSPPPSFHSSLPPSSLPPSLQKKKVRKLTNDELFYDPHMDEEDEKWVKRQRMAYHNGRRAMSLYFRKPMVSIVVYCVPDAEVS